MGTKEDREAAKGSLGERGKVQWNKRNSRTGRWAEAARGSDGVSWCVLIRLSNPDFYTDISQTPNSFFPSNIAARQTPKTPLERNVEGSVPFQRDTNMRSQRCDAYLRVLVFFLSLPHGWQEGPEVAFWAVKGYAKKPPTHITSRALIEQETTGHIIAPVKHIMYSQFTWQGRAGRAGYLTMCLCVQCVRPQRCHCRIVHWSRNVALLFICQPFWGARGGERGRSHWCRRGKKAENPLRVRVGVWDWRAVDGCVHVSQWLPTPWGASSSSTVLHRRTHIVCSELLGRAASIHRM